MTYEIEFTEPVTLPQGRAVGLMVYATEPRDEPKIDRIVYKKAVVLQNPEYGKDEARFILCEVVGKELRELADFIEKNAYENTPN